jgi:hypothetical protein
MPKKNYRKNKQKKSVVNTSSVAQLVEDELKIILPHDIMYIIFEFVGEFFPFFPKRYNWSKKGVRYVYDKGVETSYRKMSEEPDVKKLRWTRNTSKGTSQWFYVELLSSPYFDMIDMDWKIKLRYWQEQKPWEKPWVGWCAAVQDEFFLSKNNNK